MLKANRTFSLTFLRLEKAGLCQKNVSVHEGSSGLKQSNQIKSGFKASKYKVVTAVLQDPGDVKHGNSEQHLRTRHTVSKT